MSDIQNSRFLGSKAKEIIYNMSETMLKCDDKQGTSYLSKTADVAGISRSTVLRIRREKRETGMLLSPKRSKRGPYKSVDDFDQSVIRNKITEFYIVRKQLPTLCVLHIALVTDTNFPVGRHILCKMGKQMGYKWKKTKDNRKVLIERPNIVAVRLDFYRRKKQLKDIGYQIVYIDETWIDTAYTVKKFWQGDGAPGVLPPCKRGQRIIVVHAGTSNGFVAVALLTDKARSSTGDYHSEMDGKNFTKWMEEMLIPNLDQPRAIVMDNASYHSIRLDKCPTSSTKKADKQEWLRNQSIPFEVGVLRPHLLHLARINKPPPTYNIDQKPWT